MKSIQSPSNGLGDFNENNMNALKRLLERDLIKEWGLPSWRYISIWMCLASSLSILNAHQKNLIASGIIGVVSSIFLLMQCLRDGGYSTKKD